MWKSCAIAFFSCIKARLSLRDRRSRLWIALSKSHWRMCSSASRAVVTWRKSMNFHRISGLLLRYVFLYSRTPFRMLDLTFWPLMDLLVWGFMTMYMMRIQSQVAPFLTFLIGAIIFWNILYRAQQAVTVSFLEDIWSQNLL